MPPLNVLKDVVKRYPELVIEKENKKLFCPLCSTGITWDSKHGASNVRSHCKGKKHQEALQKRIKKQQPITTALSRGRDIKKDKESLHLFTVEKLIQANIPLFKIENVAFKQLLEELSGQIMPHSTTLRLKVDEIYMKTMKKIEEEINENDIYLMIDETQDIKGRFVCNVLVGILNGKPSNSMLIKVNFLKEVNNQTISQTVDEVCGLIWGKKKKFGKLLLIISDQASYMLTAVKSIKSTQMYPSLHHITCLAHALHRVCEIIRSENDEVNKIISCMKKVLKKSNKRKMQFRNLTGLPLPPEVVITRWGSWLEAVFYFGHNFDLIRKFILNLKDKSKAITESKQLIKEPNLKLKILELIQYDYLPEAIKKLETKQLKADEQIQIVEDVKAKLIGKPLQKLCNSLNKNPDYYKIRSLDNQMKYLFNTLYAPMVSCDVERSFSLYKTLLNDRRTSFTEDSIEKYMIVYYNSFLFNESD